LTALQTESMQVFSAEQSASVRHSMQAPSAAQYFAQPRALQDVQAMSEAGPPCELTNVV
jgi:hypothetical protein